MNQEELRKKAERILSNSPEEKDLSDPANIDRIIHELNVHKVELELQNDELRHIQKDLEDSRDRYSYLFDYAPVGYVILDSLGIIQQSNQTFAKMVHSDPLSLKGQPFSNYLIDADRSTFYSRFKAFHKNPTEKTIELRISGKKENVYHISLEGAKPSFFFDTLPENRKEELLLVTVSDITSQKVDEEKIRQSLDEKVTLLQEIHHRVKNNMQVISSILSLQNKATKDEQAKKVLQDCQMRVQTMSFVHETLYKSVNMTIIDMERYLQKLVKSLEHSYYSQAARVKTRIEAADIVISVEYATPLGLIVNELVSNSFKYAFPDDREGEVKIRLIEINTDELELTVSDDGIGFPEELDFSKTDSLGLSLVRILSENQLHGTLTHENSNGSKFTIRFSTK